MNELETIATFLNLVASRVKAEGGSITWFTTTGDPITAPTGTASQETQCMSVLNAIWIANNDDGDSTTQLQFLNTLGIKTQAALEKLASEYGTRVLRWHGTEPRVTLVTTGAAVSPKQKVMLSLLGGGTPTLAGKFIKKDKVANRAYALNSPSTPSTSGIVFVTGEYDGNAGTAMHAEQKLLAALGTHLQANNTRGRVTVGGCKMACATCSTALTNVRARLTAHYPLTNLHWENAIVDGYRRDAGIGADSNGGIRLIDAASYFP